MDEYESLSHSKWECKYHVIFIPKWRRKTLYQQLRQHLGPAYSVESSISADGLKILEPLYGAMHASMWGTTSIADIAP